MKAVPEMLEHIDAQHGRIPLALASRSTRDSVTASLRTLQLPEKFESLVCAGDYKRGKYRSYSTHTNIDAFRIAPPQLF